MSASNFGPNDHLFWQQDDMWQWDFAALNSDEDDMHATWGNDDAPHNLPAVPSPSPPPHFPPVRNTTFNNTYHTHGADTIFPPPHDHVAHPDSRHHSRLLQTSVTRHSPSNLQPLPPPAGRFNYIVDHLFDIPTPPADIPTVDASDHDEDFVTLDESFDESDTADMAPATRRQSGAARRSSLVDLTSGSSSQGRTGRPATRAIKRAAERSSERAPKRRALEGLKTEEIEEIDLSNDFPSAEDELRRQQQREAIRAQQAAQEDQKPQRVGQRQCIICMENYTNATVTSCGHFFCHECLTQALVAGERNSERGVGTCPVCRKALSRKRKHEIIPIAFMKKAQFAKNQSKRILA